MTPIFLKSAAVVRIRSFFFLLVRRHLDLTHHGLRPFTNSIQRPHHGRNQPRPPVAESTASQEGTNGGSPHRCVSRIESIDPQPGRGGVGWIPLWMPQRPVQAQYNPSISSILDASPLRPVQHNPPPSSHRPISNHQAMMMCWRGWRTPWSCMCCLS